MPEGQAEPTVILASAALEAAGNRSFAEHRGHGVGARPKPIRQQHSVDGRRTAFEGQARRLLTHRLTHCPTRSRRANPRAVAGPPSKRRTGAPGQETCRPDGRLRTDATSPPEPRGRTSARFGRPRGLPLHTPGSSFPSWPGPLEIRAFCTAYLAATTWPNSSVNTAFALPVCLTALASSTLTGLPTSMRATIPMA